MRHRNAHRKLNRTTAHRRALRRNQAQSLIEHGEIRTTVAKAKELRHFIEKLVTLAKQARGGDLTARREIYKRLSDRGIIASEHVADYEMMSDAKRARVLRAPSGRRHRTGQPRGHLKFTAESVVHRLIEAIAPKFADRPGGYTRVVRLPTWRIGDAGEQAVIQFVGDETPPGNLIKPLRSARRRRADSRYAFTIKLAKSSGRRGGAAASATAQAEPAGPPATAPEPT